jgi:hypothetical protein
MDEDLIVRVAPLGHGLMGLWDESTRTLWLDARLSATERRCTLVHELIHAERGDVPCEDAALDARQERRVEQEAARRLIPLGALVDSLRWTAQVDELAELLEVDVETLLARIGGLTRSEDAAVRAVMPRPED